jgi:hypothetical protein
MAHPGAEPAPPIDVTAATHRKLPRSVAGTEHVSYPAWPPPTLRSIDGIPESLVKGESPDTASPQIRQNVRLQGGTSPDESNNEQIKVPVVFKVDLI